MSTRSHTIRPDTLDRDRFAAALRESLFRMNLTQKELAERLDVSQPTVSGWVNAQKTPGRDNLARLVDELDLKPHEVTAVHSFPDVIGPGNDAIPLPHLSTRTATEKPSSLSTSGPFSDADTAAPKGDAPPPPAASPPSRTDRAPDEITPRNDDARADQHDADGSKERAADGETDDSAFTGPTRTETNSLRAAMHAENPLAVLLPEAVGEASPLQIDGYVVCSRSMLGHATPTPPDDLMVVTVNNDAMSPELPPGSSAIFSRTQRAGDHGLYVLLYDDSIIVRTVQRFAGGAMKLTSANSAYEPEMLMPTGTRRRFRSQSTGLEVNVIILGKVACYVKPA